MTLRYLIKYTTTEQRSRKGNTYVLAESHDNDGAKKLQSRHKQSIGQKQILCKLLGKPNYRSGKELPTIEVWTAKSYETQQNNKKNKEWGTIIIKSILNYTYKVWKHRNEKMHGINKTEDYNKKKQQQEKQIKKLYGKRKEYEITDTLQLNLFKYGYKKQIAQSITPNENWIELVKMIFIEITHTKIQQNKVLHLHNTTTSSQQ